jgi:hypothetical protein
MRRHEGSTEEGVTMITREEALRRLDALANEIVALRADLADGWIETSAEDATEAFLAKCSGWEDTRSPEEIIADIYATRTVSDRGANLFQRKRS